MVGFKDLNLQPYSDKNLAKIETELLQQALFRCHGLDFRDYSFPSFRRRVRRHLVEEGIPSISALQESVLHDGGALRRFMEYVSLGRKAMFRDPVFFTALRERVFPLLKEKPMIRIWLAECATGEEVFSLAILLHEEGLLEKSRLYATDHNQRFLASAGAGIIPLNGMRESTEYYRLAGGKRPFSDYYTAAYGFALFASELRENILWGRHDLTSGDSINTFDLIICRNVIVYFNKALKERVLKMFAESLEDGGILGLGHRETLRHSAVGDSFRDINTVQKLYIKEA